MSKILCTLAFYHDGGTLKPQLIFSCNPVTNLVVKGSDWKGARFSNTNATLGARNRFEYSFTGGKSVTRASLVMNTSAILPPILWLSKHPAGAPTKTGPRGKNEWRQARKQAEEERKKLEGIKETNRIEESGSPSRNHHNHHQRLLDDHPYNSRSDEYSRRHRLDVDNHSYDSRHEEGPRDHPRRLRDSYPHIPDQETRRRHRHRRLESSSSSSSSSDSPRHAYRRSRRQHRPVNNAGDYQQDDADAGGDGAGDA